MTPPRLQLRGWTVLIPNICNTEYWVHSFLQMNYFHDTANRCDFESYSDEQIRYSKYLFIFSNHARCVSFCSNSHVTHMLQFWISFAEQINMRWNLRIYTQNTRRRRSRPARPGPKAGPPGILCTSCYIFVHFGYIVCILWTYMFLYFLFNAQSILCAARAAGPRYTSGITSHAQT